MMFQIHCALFLPQCRNRLFLQARVPWWGIWVLWIFIAIGVSLRLGHLSEARERHMPRHTL